MPDDLTGLERRVQAIEGQLAAGAADVFAPTGLLIDPTTGKVNPALAFAQIFFVGPFTAGVQNLVAPGFYTTRSAKGFLVMWCTCQVGAPASQTYTMDFNLTAGGLGTILSADSIGFLAASIAPQTLPSANQAVDLATFPAPVPAGTVLDLNVQPVAPAATGGNTPFTVLLIEAISPL